MNTMNKLIVPCWVTLAIMTTVCIMPDIAAGAATSGQGFEFGFQHRMRFVDLDNIIDYTDAADDHNQFYRFRTQVWGRLNYQNWEFKLKLTNEFRHYNEPDRDDSSDEIFFDECYLKLDSIFGPGWSIKLGRQNLVKGEGFILLDGSPLDGSRSIYSNAVVLGKMHSSGMYELFGIFNPAKDRFFPRINDQSKSLIEHDERAAGIYYSRDQTSRSTLEAYYLFKTESSPYEESSSQFTPERAMHIAGGRAVLPVWGSDTFTMEAAGEIGEEDPDRDITAWAGLAAWAHSFDTSIKPQIKISAGAVSGDDPDTSKDEGWTPPFSRWPKWSELYIYSLIHERGVALWSNLSFLNAEMVFTPVDALKIRFSYYRLFAFFPQIEPDSIFGSGKDRGNLLEIRTDFKLLPGLTGHALYEYCLPGNFYSDDEPGHFLRFELCYQFSHHLPFS